jgi:hypothetical protein
VQTSGRLDAPADAQQLLSDVRAELEHIRTCVRRIERALDELEASAEDARVGARERPERYLRLLVDVYDRGGRHGVDPPAWAEIGRRHGYDRRGLGGFFTGARAPLLHDGERVRLSVHGERLVDSYLSRLAR